MIHIYLRILAIIAILNVTFCNISLNAQNLKDADLIFQIGTTSAMGDAIVAATDHGEGPVVHVGIFAMIDGVPSIIDATPEAGVAISPLTEFITDSRESEGVAFLKVMRVEDLDTKAVIDKALTYIGRPYDRVFMPGDDALYCSELIFECYLDAEGNHIFESIPMNFYASDGTLPDYWHELYAAQGLEVPQGMPGTNPAHMSSSPRLNYVTTLILNISQIPNNIFR